MINKLLLCCLLFGAGVFSQTIHEIENSINERKKDTSLLNDLIALGNYYIKKDSALSIHYLNQANTISSELNINKLGEITCLLGKVYLNYKDYDNAEIYLKQSIVFLEGLGDEKREFESISSLIYCYEKNNAHDKALLALNQLLETKRESSYFNFLILNKLGTITKETGGMELALTYYDQSDAYLKHVDTTREEIIFAMLSNDKNRGVIYRTQGDYEQAEHYLLKSLNKSVEIANENWISKNYNSLALLYSEQGKINAAIEFFERSISLKRELNYSAGIATSLSNLGDLYRQQKNYDRALELLLEADALVHQKQSYIRIANTKKKFSLLYSDLKNFEKAYHYLQEYNIYTDSFHLEEKLNLMRELDAKYKNKAYQIEQEKLKAELESADLRERNRLAQLETQQTYIFFGSGVGLLMALLIGVVIRSNVRRKQVNKKLLGRNNEITKKNKRIEEQSAQLSIKNQEILDSINYARRIQQAILPPVKLVKSFLSESFVLYLPKDIVAGDFYWMEPQDDRVIFAAADCTGHGVPGAMVSVICNNGLNRSVREYGLIHPADILNKTRDIVIQEFEKSEEEVKDGMDISLVSILINGGESTTLEYAGANNPLWVIRKGSFEESLIGSNRMYVDSSQTFFLLEVKADKQPIGKHANNKPYTNHVLSLKKDDTIYLFTDGFVDQFGGLSHSKPNKKLKPNNFRELLFSIQHESLSRQKEVLYKSFENWRGELEQVDDVCVIGVRL
jgi:serine phosphatase RsbU (regulator of sigma subunit)